jgi:hypothetical protein
LLFLGLPIGSFYPVNHILPNNLPQCECSQVHELSEGDEQVKYERSMVSDSDTCINDGAMMVKFEDARIAEITVGC